MGKVFIQGKGIDKKVYDPNKKSPFIQAFETECALTGNLIAVRFESSDLPCKTATTHGASYFHQRELYKDQILAEPDELIRKDGLISLEILLGEKLGFHNMTGPLSYRIGHKYDFNI